MPTYRSTSSTKRANPSQPSPLGSGFQNRVWFWKGREELKLVELVAKEGKSEPRGASRRSFTTSQQAQLPQHSRSITKLTESGDCSKESNPNAATPFRNIPSKKP